MKINERFYPLVATLAVLALLYGYGIFEHRAFSDTYVLGALLTDNAFLIITAVGMTFVILSGGIDLSVGSMIAFVGVLMAELVTGFGMHPVLAAVISIIVGSAFGAVMGVLIAKFDIQPFIITLAGMFFLRGMCFLINLDSVPIDHSFVSEFSGFKIPLPGRGWLTASAVLMILTVIGGIIIAHYTRFGRNVYAIGGDRRNCWGLRSMRPLFGSMHCQAFSVHFPVLSLPFTPHLPIRWQPWAWSLMRLPQW